MSINGGEYFLFTPHLRMLQFLGHGHGESYISSLHGSACEADHKVTFGDTSSAPEGLEKISAISAECTVGSLPEVTKTATSRTSPPHQVCDSFADSLSMLQTLGMPVYCLRLSIKPARKISMPANL